MLARPDPDYFVLRGIQFRVDRGVFSPAVSASSALLARGVAAVAPGRRLVELGCGCGIVAISAVMAGARHVVATEVSPLAVRCAKRNVAANRMTRKIEIVHTDDVDVAPDYDVLVCALPYVFVESSDPFVRRYGWLAVSMLDERYRFQRSVFAAASRMASRGGRALVEFGVAGDLRRFDYNLRRARLGATVVERQREGRSDNRLYELRLAPGARARGR